MFRVDLALRPNGNSGPPAVSLGALEDYFQVQGREWERFAWLKSRVVAPRSCVDSGSAQALRSRGAAVRVPPLPRLQRLRFAARAAQADPRACGQAQRRPARARQRRQALARRHPRDRIHRAAAAGGARRPVPRAAHPPHVAGAAARGRGRPDAAGHGRRAGARLRIPAPGRAPHPVPGRPADPCAADVLQPGRRRRSELDRPDHGLSPTAAPSCTNWTRTASWWRRNSTRLLGGAAPECKGCSGPKAATAPAPDLDALLEQLPAQVARAGGAVAAASARAWPCARTRARGCRGWSRAPANGWSEGRVSEEAALRMADWIEPLLRRESYLALLLERPGVHERLLRLLGAARWPARYLLQHPGVIDELASDQLVSERFSGRRFRERTGTAPALAADHRRRRRRGAAEPAAPRPPCRGVPHAGARRGRAAHGGAGGRRPERAGRRGAARDRALVLAAPEERGTARRRSSRSSATASSAARNWATAATWTSCSSTRTRTSAAPEAYAAFVRKLINWLTTKTAEGDLFEIDTALRPNGSSGPADHHLRGLRQLPAAARQQHRLDLGAPGHDPGPLRAGRRHAARGEPSAFDGGTRARSTPCAKP